MHIIGSRLIDSPSATGVAYWPSLVSPVTATTTVVSVLRPQKAEPVGLRLFWMRHPPAFAC
jgi:hypothetical protein